MYADARLCPQAYAATQKNKNRRSKATVFRLVKFVGETGFEPATSNSRSWRANRTALHPVVLTPPKRAVREISRFRVAKIYAFFLLSKDFADFFVSKRRKALFGRRKRMPTEQGFAALGAARAAVCGGGGLQICFALRNLRPAFGGIRRGGQMRLRRER